MLFSKRFLFFICWMPLQMIAQQILLVHEPFSMREYPTLNYAKDTVVFESDAKIWALVYLDTIVEGPIHVKIKNNYLYEQTAAFHLQPLNPSRLKWHPFVSYFGKELLNSPKWYYFQVTPELSAIGARNGVKWVEVFDDVLKRKTDLQMPQQFEYQVAEKGEAKKFWVDFRRGEGTFSLLRKKMQHFQKLMLELSELKQQQTEIEKQCLPMGFAKVNQLGVSKGNAIAKLKILDLELFKVVEELKILTENPPESVAAVPKRMLRELFVRDINLLLEVSPSEKQRMQQKRNSLFSDLQAFISLKNILVEYSQLLHAPKAKVVDIQLTEQKLQQIARQFNRYEKQWQAHQKLQQQIESIEEELQVF